MVDQLEELFTLDNSADIIQAFCAAMAEYAVSTAPVVAALRADHVASLSVVPELVALAERGLRLVGALFGDAARGHPGPGAAGRPPLGAGLGRRAVRDVGDEPGALPMLSHALVETWRRRPQLLTLEGYEASGGIPAPSPVPPIASTRVSPCRARRCPLGDAAARDDKSSTANLPVAGCRAGRCTTTRRATGSSSALVRARLLTAEEDSIEVAHEALVRAWPRLRAWLDEDTAGQRILRHLAVAADRLGVARETGQ